MLKKYLLSIMFIGILTGLSSCWEEPVKNTEPKTLPEKHISHTQEVQSGSYILLDYTLWTEDGSGTKVVFETTRKNDVIAIPGFSGSVSHIRPLETVVGNGQGLLAFEKNILGMKIREKKSFSLSPEDAYGTGGQIRLFSLNDIAPKKVVSVPNKTLEDSFTQVVDPKNLPKELQSLKRWDIFLGNEWQAIVVDSVAPEKAILQVENSINPFFQRSKEKWSIAVNGQIYYKIIDKNDTYSLIEVEDRSNPFFTAGFSTGSEAITKLGKLKLLEIGTGSVKTEFTHYLAGKTLYFDVEVIDIR
jgi:FKBP-type peptidyl-prolyl cis-trans isomerase 2